MAYFLGFFWADGYIRKQTELIIEITEEDGLKLQSIFNKVSMFKIYKRIRINRKPQMSFVLYNPSVAELFKNLGKYPKSIESHEKILNYIPQDYHIWFFRGLIDGDGCFYINQNNKAMIQFSITNSYYFDWDFLQNYFIENFQCNCQIKRRSHKNNTYHSSIIRLCGKTNVQRLISKLYSETDGIYLPRKFNKVKEISFL